MHLIDTHCHLYLEGFKDDLYEVMDRAKEKGVNKFYLPAIDSSYTQDLLAMEAKYPETCFSMSGLHPCSVKEDFKNELILVEELISERRFAAIGEIGLDFYWDTTFAENQYNAFKQQMQWALDKNMPVVIHTRNAMKGTIETVKPFADKGLRGIFHCFSGNEEEANQIISMNFLLGIGGVITFKNAGLAEVLANIPVENMVLETDSPYLSPVPYRGKRNESSFLIYIAEKLADIKKLTVEEIAAATTKNAENIFATS